MASASEEIKVQVPQLLCSGVVEVEPGDACEQDYVNLEIIFPGNDAPNDIVPVLACEGAGGMVTYVNGSDPNHFKAWFQVNGGTKMSPNTKAKVRYMLLTAGPTAEVKEPVVKAYLSRR